VLQKKLSRRGLPEADDAAKAVALIEEGIALSHKLAKASSRSKSMPAG